MGMKVGIHSSLLVMAGAGLISDDAASVFHGMKHPMLGKQRQDPENAGFVESFKHLFQIHEADGVLAPENLTKHQYAVGCRFLCRGLSLSLRDSSWRTFLAVSF